MAERVFDSDGVTCFQDADGVTGAIDANGNWIGFNFESNDQQCVPDGNNQFTCNFNAEVSEGDPDPTVYRYSVFSI